MLEQLVATGRCFVKATTITGEVEHGWVPMGILEAVEEEEEEEGEEESDIRQRVRSMLISDHDRSFSSQQVRDEVQLSSELVLLASPTPLHTCVVSPTPLHTCVASPTPFTYMCGQPHPFTYMCGRPTSASHSTNVVCVCVCVYILATGIMNAGC